MSELMLVIGVEWVDVDLVVGGVYDDEDLVDDVDVEVGDVEVDGKG